MFFFLGSASFQQKGYETIFSLRNIRVGETKDDISLLEKVFFNFTDQSEEDKGRDGAFQTWLDMNPISPVKLITSEANVQKQTTCSAAQFLAKRRLENQQLYCEENSAALFVAQSGGAGGGACGADSGGGNSLNETTAKFTLVTSSSDSLTAFAAATDNISFQGLGTGGGINCELDIEVIATIPSAPASSTLVVVASDGNPTSSALKKTTRNTK